MSNKLVLSKDLVILSVVGSTAALAVSAYLARENDENVFMILSILSGFFTGVFTTIFFGSLRELVRKKDSPRALSKAFPDEP
ncbi:MAG: hypothetical protein ACOH5I_19775 [Oligoflexus sp.]